MHGRSFKKRAPWAVKSVVEFARKSMGTTDVRLDPKLNQALWVRGVKSVPHRIRVKLEREYSIVHDNHSIDSLVDALQASEMMRRVRKRSFSLMPAMSR